MVAQRTARNGAAANKWGSLAVKRTVMMVALGALAACSSEPTVKAENASVDEVMNKVEASGAADASRLKAGKWSVTARVTDVKATGLPPEVTKMFDQMKARVQTAELCLSEEDVKKPDARMLGGRAPNECRFESFEMGAGVMKSVMVCARPEDGGTARISTDGTYSDEAYKVKTAMVAEAAGANKGQTMTISSEVEGKWGGKCDPAATKKGS